MWSGSHPCHTRPLLPHPDTVSLPFGRLYILSFLMLPAVASAQPPTASFDFTDRVPSGSLGLSSWQSSSPCSSATSPSWYTGGGGGSAAPFAFTCVAEGATIRPGTISPGTGPESAKVGGSRTYLYAEANAPRRIGDVFKLTYTGSACPDSGEGAVSSVTFELHLSLIHI